MTTEDDREGELEGGRDCWNTTRRGRDVQEDYTARRCWMPRGLLEDWWRERTA